MKAFLIIASLVMIAWIASADPLITNGRPIEWGALANLMRVTKLQQITFTYSLVNTNKWGQYPTLLISFNIPVAQHVQISYKTMFYLPGACFLCTRLVIDKIQYPLFRQISYGVVHANSELKLVWMEKGNHQVHVQYRSDCNFIPIEYADWMSTYLNIEYFG